MTSEQLLNLGRDQVVYLKSGMCDGKMLFVLFGAKGTPAVVADTVDAAVETAIEHGLSLVAVHRRGPCQSLPQRRAALWSAPALAFAYTGAVPPIVVRCISLRCGKS
jgi:hypothetical protein